MCYPVCGMMHIKEPLLLIGKSSPCGDSGFPLSTGVTKRLECANISEGWCIYKKATLKLIGKSSPCSGSSGFPLAIHYHMFDTREP